MACKIGYIEELFSENRDLADKLNSEYENIENKLIASKLFKITEAGLLLANSSTVKSQKQLNFINNLNREYNSQVIAKKTIDKSEYIIIDVRSLADNSNNLISQKDNALNYLQQEISKLVNQEDIESEEIPDSSDVVGFYDGEKIILNKDHKDFGIGKTIKEHIKPLLNDLDSIIAGSFDGQETTRIEKETAIKVKQKLFNEASNILEEDTIQYILTSTVYSDVSKKDQENEIIARAIEKTANKVTKDNQSFVQAVQDFIKFLIKNIRSRFYKSVIKKKSFTAKDLEPIVGIAELTNVYLLTGSAKKTMNREGKLREATAKDTKFDSIMDQIHNKGKILNIIDNSSFQEFSTKYNYEKGYNQVIPHDKPKLVDKSYNNTIYENITVDGANKVSELEASGLNPDTLNIATSMLSFGFDSKHVTILLKNPLLKEFFVRIKAKEITGSWSITNQKTVLDQMKKDYIPDSGINTDTVFSDFYKEVKDKNGNITLEPTFIVSEDKLFDKKMTMFNKDKHSLIEQKTEVLEHQFKTLLVTLAFKEMNKDMIGLSNLFNINSSGGTRSFNNDSEIYDNIKSVLSTNSFSNYDLGDLVENTFMKQVFENFVEIRDIFTSKKGISAITDHKSFVDFVTDVYGAHYTIGEFSQSKRRKFRDKLVSIIPEYVKSQVFSKIPSKDNIDYIKYKLLSNSSVDNLAAKISILKDSMRLDTNHPLNILSIFFDAIETKKERNYSVVKYNAGRVPENVKNNIKSKMLELYNVPTDIGISNDYTSKDLIDDLFDYSIVTGANSGPGKFFDYLPVELLLRDFSKLEREFEFSTTDSYDVLLNFLINNPDILPSIESLPKDYSGRIYKNLSGALYTVNKDKITGEASQGKRIQPIADKTTIKQYSIKTSVKDDNLTISGYNIITGSEQPVIYQKDDSTESLIANKSNQDIQSILNDISENQLVSKYAISDNIGNKELKAAYDELMLDNNVKSVGLIITDIIDNNLNNYARYDKASHTITISKKALESGKYSLSGILVHEYTHVVMSDIVNMYENIKNGSLSKDILSQESYDKLKFIESVYETYKQEHPEDIASENLDEFISEIRRSMDVRRKVTNLPESKRKNILSRILNSITDLIKDILGLSDDNKTLSGQQILDTTLEFITTLGNNKTFVYTNNQNNYTFTLSSDHSNNIIRVVHGTKNGVTLINPDSAYNDIINDSTYTQYFLSDSEADVLYNKDIVRKTKASYNLSVPEFNSVMKTVKTLMRENEYEHDALMDIIYKRYYDLVKTAEVNKSILKNSTDEQELNIALRNVQTIENELKRIQEHITKASKAKNAKEKMDYVDSVLDAIQDVINTKNSNPIEVLTSNYFLTKLTDVFDHTKTDVTVYSPDGKNDIIFINKEAESDPEINIKYQEQVVRVVDMNSKLLSKTMDTITEIMKNRDSFINIDFNSKDLKEDIGAYNKWLMTIDRTGDPFLNAWSYLNNEAEAAFKLDISQKIEEIKVVKDKAVPILLNYYNNLSDTEKINHYNKYGIYSLFLDENGNFKTRYNTTYFDKLSKLRRKREAAQREYLSSQSIDDLKVFKKAKKEYSDFLNKSNYSLKSEIEADLAKETNPVKIEEFNRVLDKFDADRSYKLDKFEVDLKVYINSLAKSSNKDELILEFIEENYPAENNAGLRNYVKASTGKSFEYKIEKGSVFRYDPVLMTPIKEVSKSYEYHHSIPKPEHWNDMSFLNNQDIKAFYDLYNNTFKEIRENLPSSKDEPLKLSDIPFVARSVVDYSLKDIIFNPAIRKTVITDFVQKLVLRDNYLFKNENGQSYNNESINTRFGKTNAFSKSTAINERLISKLIEANLPIYDSLGNLNPFKANRIKGAYSDKFTEIYKSVQNEVELELAEMKSFDLSLILELYYIEAMMYKHKMQELNNMNLIKDAAEKSYRSVKDSNGQPAPLLDKLQMLTNNDKMLKGIPARTARGKIFDFAGKHLSVLEKKRKKDLENTLIVLNNDLVDISKLDETEENLTKKGNIIKEIQKREDEVNSLGGNLHLGNILRQLMYADTYIRLAFNATSSLGNTIMGYIANRMEAADGRIFNKKSFDKISNKIYKNSSLTPFLAGTFTGLAMAPLSMGLGAVIGYGVNRLLHKTIKQDPETTTILNMMGMYDMVQEHGRELQLKTDDTRRIRTWRNKLMRTDAADILKQNLLFINKSEIPHQATILGSILDSTIIVDKDGNNERSILNFLTSVGSEGMKFNTDYNQTMYLRLNTTSGQVITEVPLKVLLNRIATTTVALSAKTHGNYRLNTKQLAKLDDLTVLATEFKTWAFEGFYNRYEESKTNVTISKSLTSTENQFSDQDYITKGMYQTSVEKLGVPFTFGLSMFTPNINGLLIGGIGTFSGSGLFSAVPALLQASASVYALRHLHNKRYEKNVDPNVQKAFVVALMQRVAKSTLTGKYFKRFSDVEINGVKIDADKYLSEVLSVEDAANLRKLIEQSGILISVSLLYYTAIAAKLMVGSDDDDQLERRYANFIMNTMGRTILDIESYTSAGDIWEKYGAIEKIAPTTKLIVNIGDVVESAINWEKYESSKKGLYQKGDLKFLNKLEKITPGVNQFGSFTTKLDQELEMFNANR